MTQFLRKTEMFIGGFKIPGELTVEFDIPFTDDNEINVTKLMIYNLSNNTNNLFKYGDKVVVNSGYKDDIGSIFIGNLQHKKIESDIDQKTSLTCADILDFKLGKKVNKSYAKNTKADAILKDLIKLTGLSIAIMSLPKKKVYEEGLTISDDLLKAINDVARDCEAKTHITKGRIYIRKEEDILEMYESIQGSSAFLINSDSGMIGSPTPIEDQGKQGWKVVSLLDYRINTDSVIKLESKTANGIFRVKNGRHYSNGNSHFSEMEVYA
jgi:hypothetical protein